MQRDFKCVPFLLAIWISKLTTNLSWICSVIDISKWRSQCHTSKQLHAISKQIQPCYSFVSTCGMKLLIPSQTVGRISNYIHSTGHMVIVMLTLNLIHVGKRGLGPQFEFLRDAMILLGNLTVDKIHGKRWYNVHSFVISSLDPALTKCSDTPRDLASHFSNVIKLIRENEFEIVNRYKSFEKKSL